MKPQPTFDIAPGTIIKYTSGKADETVKKIYVETVNGKSYINYSIEGSDFWRSYRALFDMIQDGKATVDNSHL